jgi:hypothetical protein
MTCRCRLQLAEALGPTNRWYCSQARGYPVEDRELLLAYFIKSGGALDFADRFEEAMGAKNRWFCSEYYGRDIRDPQTLWDYFITHAQTSYTPADADQLCSA